MDKIPEILPNAEPFLIQGGPVGCLLLHGYTGTPFEMRTLAESLAADGFTVLAPRLFAHATHPDDMLRARWWDWIASAEDGLNLLRGCSERQVVMGLSMGGVLSLLLAARHTVEAVCSFSAPYDLPNDPRIKFIKYIHWLMPRQPKGAPDWHNPDAAKDHIDYPYFPTRSILELKALIDTMRPEIKKIAVPAFFAQSHGDLTIPSVSMDYLYENVGSQIKEKLWVTDSGHVIIREPEREKVFATVKQFIRQNVKCK
jgi:carboxylesterase